MNIVIWLLALFFGKLQGKDSFGNKYYVINMKNIGRQRRFVLFKGINEPSKVPDEYEMWLRHIINEFPKNKKKFHWQKDRLPNLTGTTHAYDTVAAHKKTSSYNDYTSWDDVQNKK